MICAWLLCFLRCFPSLPKGQGAVHDWTDDIFRLHVSWKCINTIVSLISSPIFLQYEPFGVMPDCFSHFRFIFCRAVLFYFHPDEHEHLPTCLPSLPESVSPNAEAIKAPILSLAENLVVSDRFNFQNSTHKKKWWSAAITITHAFCRYLRGKYSPAICWLFRIYTANGAMTQHQLSCCSAAAARMGWIEWRYEEFWPAALSPLSVCTSFRCSLICSRHCRLVALSSISFLLAWRGRVVSWKRRFLSTLEGRLFCRVG